MSERLKEFREFRERMNERILEAGNLEIKRFFALDGRVYEDGALPTKTKELWRRWSCAATTASATTSFAAAKRV